jgi:hypothetical protein
MGVNDDIDQLFEMSTLSPRTTGINARIWVSLDPGKRHIPRLKVEPVRGEGESVISITDPIVLLAGEPLKGPMMKEVERFIIRHRVALLAHWNDKLESDELTDAIRATNEQLGP